MNSTNNQNGLNNYSTKAPKIIRKVKDEGYAGYSLKSFGVLVLWLVVSLIILAPLAFFQDQILTYALIGCLVLWWGLYIKYLRGTRFEDSQLFFKYFFDGYSGLHTIAKYDTDPAFLSDIFPLIQIHEGGLIEFKGKAYGVIMRYFPERIDEEAIKAFGQRMQLVIDGLYGESAIKFISSSKNNMKRPILDRLLEAMNRKGVNQKIFDYLHSIYQMIEGKENAAIDWNFTIFFSLGKYENLQDATDMMEARVPGLQQSLQDAGILTVKIIDRMEIAKEYRQMCLPVVI